jgi:hypothetical protein
MSVYEFGHGGGQALVFHYSEIFTTVCRPIRYGASTSTENMKTGDFPKRRKFLPFIHGFATQITVNCIFRDVLLL